MKANSPYQLYSTDGCHLCELALELVESLKHADEVLVVDIVNDEALVEAYGIRIPVIKHMASEREIGWPFDGEQLAAFFAQN